MMVASLSSQTCTFPQINFLIHPHPSASISSSLLDIPSNICLSVCPIDLSNSIISKQSISLASKCANSEIFVYSVIQGAGQGSGLHFWLVFFSTTFFLIPSPHLHTPRSPPPPTHTSTFWLFQLVLKSSHFSPSLRPTYSSRPTLLLCGHHRAFTLDFLHLPSSFFLCSYYNL